MAGKFYCRPPGSSYFSIAISVAKAVTCLDWLSLDVVEVFAKKMTNYFFASVQSEYFLNNIFMSVSKFALMNNNLV